MLLPGPYSLGQKLLLVSFRKIKDKMTGRRGVQTSQIAQAGRQTRSSTRSCDRMSSPADSEDTLTTQNTTITSSAGAKYGRAATKKRSLSDTVASTEMGPTQSHNNSIQPADLAIHIGTIFELEEQLIMRRTFRDPKS